MPLVHLKKKISNYLVSTNSQSVFKFPSYLRGWLVGLMLKQDSCLALQPAVLHDKGTFRLELQVFTWGQLLPPLLPSSAGCSAVASKWEPLCVAVVQSGFWQEVAFTPDGSNEEGA